MIVCRWKQKHGFPALAKKEKRFAMTNSLIFLKIKNTKIVAVPVLKTFY